MCFTIISIFEIHDTFFAVSCSLKTKPNLHKMKVTKHYYPKIETKRYHFLRFQQPMMILLINVGLPSLVTTARRRQRRRQRRQRRFNVTSSNPNNQQTDVQPNQLNRTNISGMYVVCAMHSLRLLQVGRRSVHTATSQSKGSSFHSVVSST